MAGEILNPQPFIENIVVHQGQQFQFTDQVLGSDEQPEPMPDWTAESKVRREAGGEVVMDHLPYLADADLGLFAIDIEIPWNAPVGKYRWDFFEIDPDGKRFKIYEGEYEIKPSMSGPA
jgi:hypothetical protein